MVFDTLASFNFGACLNQAARLLHKTALEHGFWGDEHKSGLPPVFNFAEKIALAHSELSEALEANRKDGGRGGPDEHCPAFAKVEVELADCVIRLLDLAGAMNLDLGGALEAKAAYNAGRPFKHGRQY